ncbi:HAD family hydrolase [Rhizobium sp. NPDC090279]|uniref:HAD family hydrolase n=1 Tax=Rhizobium sp. NPDC090279 TaxID=3364499 RepID=UPI00383BAD88
MHACIDWSRINLVVFDVDGTLYRQRPVRLHMARDLVQFSLREGRLDVIRVLRAFRRIREELAEAEIENFEAVLLERTAMAGGCSVGRVVSIVEEWIEKRPLTYVAAARYAGLNEVLAGIRRAGKRIGILSDYAPAAKLRVLDISPDFAVSAEDDAVHLLKPHPRGLDTIMSLAGVTASATCMIGDRKERDGLAARRAGAACLIRAPRETAGWLSFKDYSDPVFETFRH